MIKPQHTETTLPLGFSPKARQHLVSTGKWAMALAIMSMVFAMLMGIVQGWVMVTFWETPYYYFWIGFVQLLLLLATFVISFILLKAAREMNRAIRDKDKEGFLRAWRLYNLYFKLKGVDYIVTLLFYLLYFLR